jgi:16S rRNA A1518/A1519 N6-dimethyltransferase RsmA/KsgA/DIM1 with predicted DNA glycosylase/AP lyase activity
MNDYVYKDNSRPEIKPFLPQHYKKVLEIGCGLGGFKETLDCDVALLGS